MSARITVAAGNSSAALELARELELPLFVANTLVARGITTVEQAQLFLNPSLERDWENPYEIENMRQAVSRIELAIKQSEHILVYGDFDLDGISATCLMTRGLRACGAATVTPFIPLRFEEGYGLSHAAIERFMHYKPSLVVTVDNGIAAKVEVEELRALGVDVVITDHHEPADLVPEGVPVVDPKCSENSSSILAGAGVALKVIQAVGARFGKPNLWREYIDLATLGTVADLMPMRTQNRALVARGIQILNENPRPAIAALMAESGFDDKPLTSTNLSFTLIPRLNAAGRMGNADLALNLLMCDDFTQAALLAHQLEETNTQRRAIEAELAQVASAEAQRVYSGQRVLVVAGTGWHEGVKGIVASRLVNRYGVPALLFSIEDGLAHGSGRSVGQVNLFDAVSSCQDLLVRYGGHHAAVGVTLEANKLDEFTRRLCEYMDALPAEDFIPKVQVDATLDLSELSLASVSKLDCLAPFGQENPSPQFLAHGVTISGGRAVGVDKNHLSCTLTDGTSSLSAIMFRCPDVYGLLNCGVALDAVFELQIDCWKGRRSVKALLSSLKPLSPCAALEACLAKEDKKFVHDLIRAGNIDESAEEQELGVESSKQQRLVWSQRAAENPADFTDELTRAFLGEADLHASQAQALDLLEMGESVLAVMGTGRGKSLIFHLHAARMAYTQGKASIFVYPLRALVGDQAFHVSRTLASFGIRSEVLMGSSSPRQRASVMANLAAHELDIVLTTPEYLEYHVAEFVNTGAIGFVVVDEAHHIGTSKAGFRPAYSRLGDVIARLGNPQTLAVSATVSQPVAQAITESLGITRTVYDETQRTNLVIEDMRNTKKRESYLVNLVAQGEKTLIYVNSRMETISLVRKLRKQEPHIASLIGFYNAGLARAERQRIEQLFREGALQVLVATSAFGEGVDIPGIRHVVLYHLPFSEVEFNQMAGRAGRDGQPALVHLLFGSRDSALSVRLLEDAAPNHDAMAQIYRALRARGRKEGTEYFQFSPKSIARTASRLLGEAVSESQVQTALSVFDELGLVALGTSTSPNTAPASPTGAPGVVSAPPQAPYGVPPATTQAPSGQEHASTYVHVVDYQGKVELESSVRYCEGLAQYDEFSTFEQWVLHAPAQELQSRIRRPLLP